MPNSISAPEAAGPSPATGAFVSPCPPPTGYDAEILVVINEELHEICEAIASVLAEARNTAPTPTLCRHLALEVGDLYETVRRAHEAGTLPAMGNLRGDTSTDDHLALVHLLGAASHAGQRVCKSLRFGLQEVQPGHAEDNATRTARSIGAVRDAVFAARALISSDHILDGITRKRRQLDKFLQTSPRG